MFGYVKIHKPELRVWEYEIYNGVYCSLCKKLGKTYGPLARLTLSYDFTFLAVLSMALKEGAIDFKKKSCPFNPMKKCNYCTNANDELDFASGAAMLMVYYKLLDNIEDSKFIKKLGYKLLVPFFKLKHNKAKKLYPKIDEIIDEYITSQDKLEKENCNSLDEICEPTALALGKIFEFCSNDVGQKKILYQMGYCIGKWIYLIDCGADLEKDIKNGGYNPLKFHIDSKTDTNNFAKEKLTPLLNTCIVNAQLSFELLDIKKYKGILDNVLYFGLTACQNAVFKKEKK